MSETKARAEFGSLGIFRRDQTDAERAEGADAASQEVPHTFPGENLALRRRVDVPGAPSPVFVWPGGAVTQEPDRSQVCIAYEGGSGCSPLDFVNDQGMSILTYVGHASDGKIRVGAVVRDGVDEVVIEQDKGSSLSVEVRDNVFLADADSVPVAVSWSDSEGEHRLPVESPLDP